MKYNTLEVATLRPDYLGFIFWEPSKRFFNGQIPSLPLGIKKVGVFVDASLEVVLEKIEKYGLWGVQLHGDESPEYCEQLKAKCHAELVEAHSKDLQKVQLIKVFSIKDNFDFSILASYEEVCDYYLFDTKGKLPGGNGYTFNWKVLENYPSTKPYFLSGGIGLKEVESVKEFMQRPESKYCYAIDVNSRFEIEPGLKNIVKLKEFKKLYPKY
ncbi:phosphoribosylanthranilate isomerase [Maribacter halichondriae]|uniref:phosphoribosylanthranilate isomerase n=1 Tax=Maribacter halichondriae TaxID=2980554 RepID=UPI002359820F|nr:phosphoribosylanthranilate isomerase [Maribacter sp. Hal144]